MKNLNEIISENQEVKTESEKCNIWNTSNPKHWELVYQGDSKEDCQKIFLEREYTDENEKIQPNGVIDHWVEGETGYITFSNNITITITIDSTEKMFRLMNHDSSHTEPVFESYTIEEHNKQFGTNYKSVEEATGCDPEYLFTEKEMNEYLS